MDGVKCAKLFFLLPLIVSGEAIDARDWCSTKNLQTDSISYFLTITGTMPLVLRTFDKDPLQPNPSSAFNGASLTTTGFNGAAAEVAAARSLTVGGSGLACGPDLVCDSTAQYCHIVVGGPAGAPPGYSCADFPEGSPSPPTCESIAETWIGCECTESGGGITVTCTAP